MHYDVVVVGAGVPDCAQRLGMAEQGLRTACVTKGCFPRARTPWPPNRGIAASLGKHGPDSWQVAYV